MASIDFTKYYIVRRHKTKSGEAGISYDVTRQRGNFLIAHSNQAIAKPSYTFRIDLLTKGLSRKDYRLVPKSNQ